MESSKQWYSCENCGKNLSSYYSHWRHKKSCHPRKVEHLANSSWSEIIGNKRPLLSSDITPEKPSKNPKIQALLHEIINGSTPSADEAAATVLPSPPPEVVADLFRKESSSVLPIPSEEVVIDVFQKPRTKGEIIGYSDDDDDERPGDSDDDDDERPGERTEEDALISYTPMELEAVHGGVPRFRAVDFVTKQSRTKGDIIGYSDDDEDEEVEEPAAKVKFLPSTVKGLLKRFNHLFKEFRREGKYEHRNELVFLLDELLRQGGISREEYTSLNNLLAESLDETNGDGKMDEDGDDNSEHGDHERETIKKLSESTIDYLIQDDKKELLELLNRFKNEDKDFIDTVLELEGLIDVYLLDDIIDNEPVIEKLDEVRQKLEKSAIPKSKLQRLKILLHDIDRNRHRVRAILKRLVNANGQEQHVLEQLTLEELLSEEQRLALEDARLSNELVPTRIAAVIKGTKIGQGLKFLPCKLNDLVKSLQTWLEQLAERDQSDIRKKVGAVLEELLKRNGITLERYTAIKRDNNIL